MTWINRLRLLAGLLGVLLLVAVLTLIFNQRQTKAASLSATISADTYSVGAAYGGTVTKQYVGMAIRWRPATSSSPSRACPCKQDVANGLKMQSSPAYDVDTADGHADLPRNGRRRGQLSAGPTRQLARRLVNPAQRSPSPTRSTSTRHYLLSPRDYGRMTKGCEWPPFCCPTTSALPAP